MSRSVRVILGILVVLILVVGAVGGFCWWKMTQLKGELVQGLEKAVGAQVQVTSLDLDLWKEELHAAGISLTNDRASAPWSKGEISQATIRFHLLDVLSPTLPLSVDVSSWNVVLTPSASSTETATASSSSASSEPTESSPSRIQVTEITAHDGSVEIDLSGNRQVNLQGVDFAANNNASGIWTTDLKTTSVKAGSLEAGASSVQIRGEKGQDHFFQSSHGVRTGFPDRRRRGVPHGGA